MPSIVLNKVSLDYPIYDPVNRSLTRSITQSLPVGGRIRDKGQQRVSILALDDVSVALEEGDRVALLGHNGAGKTSMLKVLAGFYEPTSGSICHQGKVCSLLDLTAGMDFNLTGYDNIMLCGMLHGLSKTQIKEKLEDIAEFSELGSYLDLPIRLYSQGMILRLAFSICTSVDGDILLLDEWVGAGDHAFMQKAKQRLSEMILRSSILVFATHSHEVALHLCNKAFFLEHGKLLFQGDIHQAIEFQQARQVSLAEPQGE